MNILVKSPLIQLYSIMTGLIFLDDSAVEIAHFWLFFQHRTLFFWTFFPFDHVLIESLSVTDPLIIDTTVKSWTEFAEPFLQTMIFKTGLAIWTTYKSKY